MRYSLSRRLHFNLGEYESEEVGAFVEINTEVDGEYTEDEARTEMQKVLTESLRPEIRRISMMTNNDDSSVHDYMHFYKRER